MMQHRIETIKEKWVVGMTVQTSLFNISNDTKQLAQRFMPRRSEISSRVGNHVFSIQNYGPAYNPSNPKALFEKWVAVEVSQVDELPKEMNSFLITSGTYAVFSYKGSASNFSKARAYIFQEWLPNSGYMLDQKAHFEILNENYSKNFSHTEEDIWIPIIKKP